MVTKRRSQTHLFQFFDLQPRFQIARVQSRNIAQLWGKICRFLLLKMYGIQIGPSDLHHKITPHSNILAKVLWGGILWPRRLERKKVINKLELKMFYQT